MSGGYIELTLATIAILGVGIYFAKHILRPRDYASFDSDPYLVDVLKGGGAQQDFYRAGGGGRERPSAANDAQVTFRTHDGDASI